MSKVACYAGNLPHFSNHLAPIWKALPPELKDGFYASGRAATRADDLGICVDGDFPRRKELVMVASYEDYRATKDAKVILVNHGVGQTYIDGKAHKHPSYSGGNERERVVLHLCTSDRDAANCPNGVAVGVPYLDLYHLARPRPSNDKPVVAISFHADIHLCPETRWAFPYYRNAIMDLARNPDLPFTLLAHAHPRAHFKMSKWWKTLGVPYTDNWFDVLERADLYICDNSSTLYEFASLDKPVIALSAPWYRRDVHHGLRFWDAIPGLHVERPDDLLMGINHALQDFHYLKDIRETAVLTAYNGLTDGRATERAVQAICELVNAHAR